MVGGLRRGGVGGVPKVHPSAMGGSSGAGLRAHVFGLEPEAAGPERPAPPEPEHIPTDLELVGHAGASRLRKTGGLG